MSTTRLPYYFVCGCIRLSGSIDQPALRRALSVGTRTFAAAANLPLFSQHDLSVTIIDFTTAPQPQKEAECWIDARCCQPIEPAFSLPLEFALIKLDNNHNLVFLKSHRSLFNEQQLFTFSASLGEEYCEILAAAELQLTNSAHELNSSGESNHNTSSIVNQVTGASTSIVAEPGDEINQYQFLNKCQLKLLPHQQVLLEEIQVCFNVPLDALALAASLVYAEKLEQGAIDPQQGEVEEDNAEAGDQSTNQQIIYPGATIENFVKGLARPGDKQASSLEIKPGQHGSVNESNQNTTLDFGDSVQADFESLSQGTEMQAPAFCWFERAEDNALSLNLHFSQHTAGLELARLHLQRLLFIAEQLHPAVCTLVNDIKIVPPGELELIAGFGHSSIDYPRSKTIVDLFETSAAETPGAEALVFEKQRLSYAELNARSNQLAHFLVRNGIAAGELVPICMERSAEMIIS
ncbi:MAG: AMP-binding protein, partial [Ferruginibacter sp.]|nr:AMP-binding protein [Ferruginibacter sp.]